MDRFRQGNIQEIGINEIPSLALLWVINPRVTRSLQQWQIEIMPLVCYMEEYAIPFLCK